MTHYEPIENVHKNQILYKSKIPADISDKIFKNAVNNAKKIAENFSYVGVLTIEFLLHKKMNYWLMNLLHVFIIQVI